LTRRQRKEKKGAGGSSKVGIHTKSFVFDRKQVFIGSLNLDPRSKLHNTEIGVVLKVPKVKEGTMTSSRAGYPASGQTFPKRGYMKWSAEPGKPLECFRAAGGTFG
jgi:phosphatidylserine/phosphatidylglycerophosphate/cardiolipin synthase-like enzyme